jgi:hypothetical protein
MLLVATSIFYGESSLQRSGFWSSLNLMDDGLLTETNKSQKIINGWSDVSNQENLHGVLSTSSI